MPENMIGSILGGSSSVESRRVSSGDNMVGKLGPYMSASKSPTFFPNYILLYFFIHIIYIYIPFAMRRQG